MRNAKIVCTLGPASATYEQIRDLADAGMNCARINLSHGKYEQHAEVIAHVRRVSDPRILNACAYLAHGTGQHLWQEFLAVLEKHAGELHNEADIVQPARRAFDLFFRAAAQS